MLENTSENPIITDSTLRNFIKFVVPAIISLLAISSAGIIDGIFVGHYIGATALASVNIVTPMYYLFFGICVLVLSGSMAIIGQHLGKGEIKEASNLSTKAIIIIVAYSVICMILAFLLSNNIASLLGAKGEVLPLTSEYINTISPFLLFMGLTYSLSGITRVDGAPNYALTVLVTTTVTNIILNIILIKVLDYGIFGAALASGISYTIGGSLFLLRFLSKKTKIRLIKPYGSWKKFFNVFCNGFSEFTNEVSGGLIVLILNWVIMTEIGSNGVAAYTVIYYLMFFSMMFSYGICEGLGPLISINFGANKADRITKFIKYGFYSSMTFGVVIVSLLLFKPDFIVGLFIQDDAINAMDITLTLITIIWPVFLFSGINLLISIYFTCIQKAKQSAIISLSRSLILPVGLIFGLWHLYGLKGAFVALPLAELITLFISIALFRNLTPKKVLN